MPNLFIVDNFVQNGYQWKWENGKNVKIIHLLIFKITESEILKDRVLIKLVALEVFGCDSFSHFDSRH